MTFAGSAGTASAAEARRGSGGVVVGLEAPALRPTVVGPASALALPPRLARQAALSRPWIENNRRLERVVRKMRELSLRVAGLHEMPKL